MRRDCDCRSTDYAAVQCVCHYCAVWSSQSRVGTAAADWCRQRTLKGTDEIFSPGTSLSRSPLKSKMFHTITLQTQITQGAHVKVRAPAHCKQSAESSKQTRSIDMSTVANCGQYQKRVVLLCLLRRCMLEPRMCRVRSPHRLTRH